MTKIKYKKLEKVIDTDDSSILHLDLDSLKKVYNLLTIIYHRNKNQHNMKLYFKHVKSLRKCLYNILIETFHDKKNITSIKLYGLIKYNSKFNKNVIKKMVFDFYNVINAKTFINLAIVMITIISEIYDLLIIKYVNVIDDYLRDKKNLEIVKIGNRLRIMAIKHEKINNINIDSDVAEIINSNKDLNLINIDVNNDDLGEEIVIIEEEEEREEEKIEISDNSKTTIEILKKKTVKTEAPIENKIKKGSKKDKKKKKKGKSLIDDIFSGF